MLIGPVIAPIIGGFLSDAFGWRSTFVLLAILTTPIFVYIIIFLPETHHWLVLQKIKEKNQHKLSMNQNRLDSSASLNDNYIEDNNLVAFSKNIESNNQKSTNSYDNLEDLSLTVEDNKTEFKLTTLPSQSNKEILDPLLIILEVQT